MKNLKETFIDFNMDIERPSFNNETRMSFVNDTIKLIGNEFENMTFRDSYNIQPGKSIRPEWELGYPMLVVNNQTNFGSLENMSFRFKKPVLHKYDNTQIWFNYLYNNNKEMLNEVSSKPSENVEVKMGVDGIDVYARDEQVFYLKFNQLNIKSADGLYHLDTNTNIVGLADKFLVLKASQSGFFSTVKMTETFGTIGNFLENATIKVKTIGFEEEGKIRALNGQPKDIHTGDVRVSFEVENFPFKNEGDSLELGFTIIHPELLKVLDESDDFIAKYSKGQIDIPRWVKNDHTNYKMDQEFPKISSESDIATTFSVNFGTSASKKSEFEMFLHPAKKNELSPIRRFDSTNWTSNYNGNIKALAKHNVECRNNEVLSYWNMKSRSGKISIEYYCISFLSVGKKSEIKYTGWNKISSKHDKSLNYLDRHTLLCDSDESIGAFRMQLSGNSIRFRYRCTKTTNTNLSSRTTKYERVGEGQVYNLKNHYLFGVSNKDTLNVLRGWSLSTRYVNKWCTFMCDKFQEIKFKIFYNTLRNFNDHI